MPMRRILYIGISGLDTFSEFDRNGDGEVDAQEFGAGMISEGVPLPEDLVEHMMEDADHNGDGKLNREEFSHMMG